MEDFEAFVKEEKENIVKSSIEDDYKTFLDRDDEELEKKFNVKNKFQTSVRGIKARGNFATEEEARLRAKMLREVDPDFDIMVGPIGVWMPWEPEAYKTGRVEYMEDELNQLMHEKTKNETFAKNAFEQRVKETKKKAIEENIKNATKSGSSLTQNIDSEGNLVGINNMNTQEKILLEKEVNNSDISVSDIRNELFEGDNIIVGNSDYGKSLLESGIVG
jgi:hypothetical protein